MSESDASDIIMRARVAAGWFTEEELAAARAEEAARREAAAAAAAEAGADANATPTRRNNRRVRLTRRQIQTG